MDIVPQAKTNCIQFNQICAEMGDMFSVSHLHSIEIYPHFGEWNQSTCQRPGQVVQQFYLKSPLSTLRHSRLDFDNGQTKNSNSFIRF